MKHHIIKISLGIFVIANAIFFTLYLLMDINFYQNLVNVGAFALPAIFTIGALTSVFLQKKKKGTIGFREAFKNSFMPMFIGGLLSFVSIGSFVNYGDENVKQVLNYQFRESFKNSLEEEFVKAKSIIKPKSEEYTELLKKYEEAKQRIQYEQEHKKDMFSPAYFSFIFAGYCLFFLILSIFLGTLFRTKSKF